MATNGFDPLDFGSYTYGGSKESASSAPVLPKNYNGGEDPAILKDFQDLASTYNAKITSLFRTPEHNAKVGGVSNSQHLKGTAGDFVVPEGNKADFIAEAVSRGYMPLDEGNHIHLQLPHGREAAPADPLDFGGGGGSTPTRGQKVADPLDFGSYTYGGHDDNSDSARQTAQQLQQEKDYQSRKNAPPVVPAAVPPADDSGGIASTRPMGLGYSFMKQFMPDPEDATKRDVGAAESAGRGFVTRGNQIGASALRAADALPGIGLVQSLAKRLNPDVQTNQEAAADLQSTANEYAPQANERQGMGAKVSGALGSAAIDLPVMIGSGGESKAAQLTKEGIPLVKSLGQRLLEQGAHGARAAIIPSVVAGEQTSHAVKEAGGSDAEAAGAGAVDTLTSLAQNSLLFGMDGKLAVRLAAGAGIAVAGGRASNALVNPLLPDSIKRQNDDSTNAVVGGLMGALLGRHDDSASKSAALTGNVAADSYGNMAADAHKVNTEAALQKQAADQVEAQRKDAEQRAQQDNAKKAAADAQRKADEIEADHRNQQLVNQYAGQTRLETYPDGSMERVPVHPPAGVTADDIAAEREQKAQDEADAAKRVELGTAIEQLRTRQQLKDKTAAEQAAAKQKEQADAAASLQKRTAAAQEKQKNQIADQLLAENPGKTLDELGPEYLQRMKDAGPPVVPGEGEVSPEDRVASVRQKALDAVETNRKKAESIAKAKNTKALNNKIQKYMKAFPNATDEDIINHINGTAPEKTTKPDNQATNADVQGITDQVMSDHDIREQARKAGIAVPDANPSIGMADVSGGSNTADTSPEARAAFLPKLHEAIKSLVGRGYDNPHIQNLIRLRQLVIAPNAESIGRKATNNRAEYDPTDGKTYIYMDNIDPKMTVPEFLKAAAKHESGHGVQFSEREGRPSTVADVFAQRLGDKVLNPVMDAAKKGNKLALAAVDQASKQAEQQAAMHPDNPHAKGIVLSRELIPAIANQFVSAEANGKPLGRLGGVYKQMIATGRALVRDNLKVPLKLTMNDIAHASQTGDKELVRTLTEGGVQKGHYGEPIGMAIRNKGEGEVSEQLVDSLSSYNNHIGDMGPNDPMSAKRRMVKQYLHKYAGTPEDPLKDVRLPDGERWEDVMDKAMYEDPRSYNKKRIFEDAYNVDNEEQLMRYGHKFEDPLDDSRTAFSTLFSYLNHVEDYLHTVNPDKLPQYDLVRAVKETQRWDAEAAARAEKERKAGSAKALEAMKNMPVHKSYPDGFKWVQLTKPGEFAHESNIMGHSVKGYEPTKYIGGHEAVRDFAGNVLSKENPDYSAASGNSGHKNYGVGTGGWEAIKNGSAKIYSLRDKDGLSHVTIEVEDLASNPDNKSFGKRIDPEDAGPATITQIKGKGNAKPVSKYIPYVQDFVRSGKWGDVSDLGNADLIRPKQIQQGFHKDDAQRILSDLHSKYGKQDFYTHDEVNNKDQTDYLNKPLGWGGKSTPKEAAPAEKLKIGEALRRITDHGTRAQTADTKQAEDYDTQYRNALSQDAKGRDLHAVNKDILDAITHIDNADPKTKQALWNAFGQKYPKLAPVLSEARAAIDDQSRAVVGNILGSGVKLSPKDIRNVSATLSNIGTYLTRAYAAFQGRTGRKWAENRWTDFKTKMDIYQKGGRLSTNAKQNIEAMQEGIKYIQDRLVIPERDDLEDMPMTKLEPLYNDHIGPTERLGAKSDDIEDRREAMIDQLDARRQTITPEEYNNMATQAAKELIGLAPKTSNYIKVFNDLVRDPGTLKEKTFVPEELRRMLGELTDPGARILTTLQTLASQKARSEVLNDVLKQGNGKWVVGPSQIHKPGMIDKFPEQLKGEQYGPLNGFYVIPRVANALKDQAAIFHTYGEALRRSVGKGAQPTILLGKLWNDIPRMVLAKTTRAEKIFSVVGNPYRWASNAIGSPLNLLRSGNISPTTWARGINSAYDYVWGARTARTTPLLQDAIRYVNVEAVDVAELQRVLGDKLKDYMDEKITAQDMHDHIANKSTMKEKTHTVGRTIVGQYAMLDAWVKIANFYDRVNTLAEYYKKAGVDKTPEEIKREAGDVTSYTNLSNERVPKWFKLGEERGITKFAPYFSETLRTSWTNFNQAFRDLARAQATENSAAANVLRRAAMKRMIGNTIATIAMPARFPVMFTSALLALGYARSNGFALTADDPDSAKKRRLLSDYNRYQDLLPFGKDKDGKPVYLAISQAIDPNGPATDITRIFANSEDPKEALVAYLKSMILLPRWMTHMATAITNDTVPQSSIASNFPAFTDHVNDFFDKVGVGPSEVNKGLYSIESLVPGMSVIGSPKYKVNVDPNGDSMMNTQIKAMEAIGASFETFDPMRVLKQHAHDSGEHKTGDAAKFTSDLFSMDSLSDSSFMDSANRFRARELDRFAEGRKDYDSLKAWGYGDDAAQDLLKQSGFSNKEAQNIVEDNNRSTVKLTNMFKSKGADSEAKQQAIKDMMDKNSSELDKLGIDVEE